MDIDISRKIDYLFGVPICFFLTIIARLSKVFSFKEKKENVLPKKFLFIELSEMGSAILAYPTMRKINEDYPDAELFFLIFNNRTINLKILNLIKDKNLIKD